MCDDLSAFTIRTVQMVQTDTCTIFNPDESQYGNYFLQQNDSSNTYRFSLVCDANCISCDITGNLTLGSCLQDIESTSVILSQDQCLGGYNSTDSIDPNSISVIRTNQNDCDYENTSFTMLAHRMAFAVLSLGSTPRLVSFVSQHLFLV